MSRGVEGIRKGSLWDYLMDSRETGISLVWDSLGKLQSCKRVLAWLLKELMERKIRIASIKVCRQSQFCAKLGDKRCSRGSVVQWHELWGLRYLSCVMLGKLFVSLSVSFSYCIMGLVILHIWIHNNSSVGQNQLNIWNLICFNLIY